MFLQSFLILWVLAVDSWCSKPLPYDVRLESVRMMPSENYSLATSQLRLMGRERSINGTVTLLEDLNDEHFELTIDFYSDSTGTGNFKKALFNMPRMPICQFFKTFIIPYMELYGYTLKYNINTDFPIDGTQCPIPKGTYYFKNVSINTDGWPHEMPLGYFRGIGSIYKDNEIVETINWDYQCKSFSAPI